MNATPLTIDAEPSDISVLASGLQLRNNAAVREAMRRNREVREGKKRQAGVALRKEAIAGAEFIQRRSTSTKSVRLEDVTNHYGLT